MTVWLGYEIKRSFLRTYQDVYCIIDSGINLTDTQFLFHPQSTTNKLLVQSKTTAQGLVCAKHPL